MLSEEPVESDWVETEVEIAFAEEKRRKKTVFFPIRIDDAVMETKRAWARQIRDTCHIGDFSNWKDHDAFESSIARLLSDLKQEAAEEDSPDR